MALTNYLEIRNNDKRVIINDGYRNLMLQEIITLADYDVEVIWQDAQINYSLLKTIYAGVGYMVVNFYPFDEQNLLGIYCDASDVRFATSINNNILTVYVKLTAKEGVNDDYVIADVEYIKNHVKILRYGPTPNLTIKNYGLQVFDKNGTIIFDSNRRYMRVVDVISQDIDDVSDISKEYAAKIAVIPVSSRYTGVYNPQQSTFYRHFFCTKYSGGKTLLDVATKLISYSAPGADTVVTGLLTNTNLIVLNAAGIF